MWLSGPFLKEAKPSVLAFFSRIFLNLHVSFQLISLFKADLGFSFFIESEWWMVFPYFSVLKNTYIFWLHDGALGIMFLS